jgi:hypothetical protein
MTSARSHFEILLLRMCSLLNIPLQHCIMHISTEMKITSSPNVMVEIGHWLLQSLPCYYFDFTNQLTLQLTFDTSAAFGEF